MPDRPTPTSTPILGEFDRIERYLRPLAAGLPGALGLADDAAVLDVPAGMQLVVTTDAMVAGIHFLPGDPPGDIAWKLLAVNLSDLAAKGAQPFAYSLVTALPRDLPAAWLAGFTAGLAAGQDRWGVHLAGGDSVSTPGPISLTVSALGLVPAGRMVTRAGARPGDLVFVSGSIGDAALGLALVLGRLERGTDLAGEEALIARLRRPEPRLSLAPMLRDHATAAVDISDGLVADLGHVARASGVTLVVEAAKVPVSPAAAEQVGLWPGLLSDMLTGGDDYEVAFTAPAAAADAIGQAAAAAGVPVAVIGRVTDIWEAGQGQVGPGQAGRGQGGRGQAGSGVRVIDRAGAPIELGPGGWRHF
ncbi:MAG: thiamine-monophosphate kinase [Pseudomonadota bacterium]|jgi:thiamine-monophosphate kinase